MNKLPASAGWDWIRQGFALFRKQHIAWDPRAEKITNDEGANKLLGYEYREPWKLS